MFKDLFNHSHNTQLYIIPSTKNSPIRDVSPLRINKTPITLRLSNSPIKNRRNNVQPPQYFVKKHFIRTFSPCRNTSPMKHDLVSHTPINYKNPRQSQYQHEVVHLTPTRATIGSTPPGKYQHIWKIPSQTIGNKYPKIEIKQQNKLFTNLIKRIKSQGFESNSRVSPNKEPQIKNLIIQDYQSNNVSKSNSFKQQNKVNGQFYESQNNNPQINFSFNKSQKGIPWADSIQTNKLQLDNLQQSLLLSQSQIILIKDNRDIQQIKQSISYNDRVISSSVSDSIELNMSLGQ